jgi:hypothetical protein
MEPWRAEENKNSVGTKIIKRHTHALKAASAHLTLGQFGLSFDLFDHLGSGFDVPLCNGGTYEMLQFVVTVILVLRPLSLPS